MLTGLYPLSALAEDTEEIEHEHNYEPNVVEPTCTSAGYTVYSCECGESYESDSVEPAGHIPEFIEAAEPTATEDGNIECWHCVACGAYFADEELRMELSEEHVFLPALGGAAETEAEDSGPDILSIGNGSIVGSGSCGVNLSWTLDDTGLVTVSGTGTMTDYSAGTAPWYGTDGARVEQVVIDSPVESIGAYAFYNCGNLVKVTIPSTVASIGANAFGNCGSLTDIFYSSSADMWDEIAQTDSGIPSGIVRYYGGSVVDSGFCGDGVQWTLKGNGLLTISGQGAMADYVYERRADWYKYNVDIRRVVVSEGVTSIGSAAFIHCSNIEVITLPSSLQSIGSEAFAGCYSIGSLAVPEGVRTIGGEAFYAMYALQSLSLPVSLQSIGVCALDGCEKLPIINYAGTAAQWAGIRISVNNCSAWIACTDRTLVAYGNYNTSLTWALDGNGLLTINGTGNMTGDTVGSIPWYPYQNQIRRVVLSEGVTSIAGNSFSNCGSLTGVTIPNSVTAIGVAAFSGCSSLTGISIPNGVITIGMGAFGECGSLTSVVLPDSLTSISEILFYACGNLKSVTIPAGVTSIEESAFRNCGQLTDIYFLGTTAQWSSIEKSRAEIPAATTIHCSVTASGRCGEDLVWILEDSGKLTIIGSGPMTNYPDYHTAPWDSHCRNIAQLQLPDGLTSIGNYAFCFLSNLQSVSFPDSVTGIGTAAFFGSGLTALTLPDTVTGIGFAAFAWCEKLTSVTVSAGMTSIPGSAFAYCHALTTVTIPASITSIGEAAFIVNESSALTDIYYSGTSVQWNRIRKQTSNIPVAATVHFTNEIASGNCGENLAWILEKSGTLNLIGSGPMTNYPDYHTAPWDSHCREITQLQLPDGLTSIGNYAFCFLSNLQSVSFPDSVTGIGTMSFFGSGLTALTLPDTVTGIGFAAFAWCEKLTSVTVSAGMTSIPGSAFAYCHALTTVTIPASITSIGEAAFIVNESSALTDIYYSGPSTEWNSIQMRSADIPLSAAVHFSVTVGDYDEDGFVTSDDAIYLLYATLLPEDYPLNQTTDYDGDGHVTSDDAIYLLFYTVFPDEYPIIDISD